MKSIFLADVVYVVHFIICVVLIFGCFLPKQYLIYHILLFLIVSIQFQFTGNKCILTHAEDELRSRPSSYTEGESPFFGRMFSLLGITDNNELSNLISGSLVQISFVISFIRYCI